MRFLISGTTGKTCPTGARTVGALAPPIRSIRVIDHRRELFVVGGGVDRNTKNHLAKKAERN